MMKLKLDIVSIDFYMRKGICNLYDKISASDYWQDNFLSLVKQINIYE
jgi:hypothetical protein